MMNKIFNKIKLIWQKPKVVIVINNDDREMVKKFIGHILGASFKINKEVLFSNNIEKIDLLTIKHLILNFDDTGVKKFKEEISVKVLTFGFQERADLRATDINLNHLNQMVNFKVNHQGNVVPIWLEKYSGKEQIYAALAAISIGLIFELNLVEISQALKKN